MKIAFPMKALGEEGLAGFRLGAKHAPRDAGATREGGVPADRFSEMLLKLTGFAGRRTEEGAPEGEGVEGGEHASAGEPLRNGWRLGRIAGEAKVDAVATQGAEKTEHASGEEALRNGWRLGGIAGEAEIDAVARQGDGAGAATGSPPLGWRAAHLMEAAKANAAEGNESGEAGKTGETGETAETAETGEVGPLDEEAVASSADTDVAEPALPVHAETTPDEIDVVQVPAGVAAAVAPPQADVFGNAAPARAERLTRSAGLELSPRAQHTNHASPRVALEQAAEAIAAVDAETAAPVDSDEQAAMPKIGAAALFSARRETHHAPVAPPHWAPKRTSIEPLQLKSAASALDAASQDAADDAASLDEPELPVDALVRHRRPMGAAVEARSLDDKAPVQSAAGSPAHQVASQVARELSPSDFGVDAAKPEPAGSTAATPTATRPEAFAMPQPAARGPVKVFTIALHPANLGRVTVQLRTDGEAVQIAVTAERAEALDLLSRDRDELANILKKRGFEVDDVTIRLGGTERASAPADMQMARPSAQPMPQQHLGDASGGAAGERQRSQQSDERATSHTKEENGDEVDIASRPRGDHLYV